MIPVSVKTLAHAGAGEKMHKDAIESLALEYSIHMETFEKPAILLFLTGGSEAEAVQYLDETHFQILAASGRSNAFASAMEVKAYSNAHGFRNKLINLDDKKDDQFFRKYIEVIGALKKLGGKRLGLIGEVSEWLVSSNISADLLLKRLGIELVKIPWKDAGDFTDLEAERSFIECFHGGRHYNIEDAGRVNALLKDVIKDHKLDAITVECFSLVQEKEVTACLGLSFLNDLGIPAGCEGDLCSITGMMIGRELFHQLPWMANIASIRGNEVLFAHCTAPTSLLSEYHINTHFETGKGTAIHGRFNAREVSVFRLNNTLDRLFHARGRVVDGIYEKHACRTQLHVEFDPELLEELKEHPLGNHHLILPGDRELQLKALADLLS